MNYELTYWRHPSLPGIKVEEVSGECDPGRFKLWLEMARQVWSENGKDGYRELGHFKSGAPFMYGYNGRISISHTPGLLAVATLPPTPEVELGEYSDRAAMGVDVEHISRRDQVKRVAERFMNLPELREAETRGADSESYVLAWTIKEAIYKAALLPGLDFCNDIAIEKWPVIGPATTHYDPKEYDPTGRNFLDFGLGQGSVIVRGAEVQKRSFLIYSYRSDDFIVTLAFAPRCAKFGGQQNPNPTATGATQR